MDCNEKTVRKNSSGAKESPLLDRPYNKSNIKRKNGTWGVGGGSNGYNRSENRKKEDAKGKDGGEWLFPNNLS